MVVGVLAGDSVRVGLGQALDALIGLEVVLHPEPIALGVDPHVRVRRVAVHLAP